MSTVGFQNQCGLNSDAFLELLSFYLSATFVKFDDELYVQREGVCIGSSVAPVLCHIFLAKFDRLLKQSLNDDRVVKIFRYVDDFLVFKPFA